jgi:hypothetical protein
MPVELSNRDLQCHLDCLKKSVLVKFELTVASQCRIHVVSKKVATMSTLQITLKFLMNYEVLHISSEHRTAQLSIFKSSQPPQENVVYGIVSLT